MSTLQLAFFNYVFTSSTISDTSSSNTESSIAEIQIIKKREEIQGFKSVDEFFDFIKLKPHIEKQLRELIKTEKMKGSVYHKKYKERSVDF